MIFKKFVFLFVLVPTFVFAKLNVITTTTDLKWLVEKIGGKHVKVESLLSGTEDPHYIDAMPHFVAKIANADMFCLIGMDLEVGWAPKMLTRAGNSKVQPGGPGYCETGKTVSALDVPTGKIDRSRGDIHPGGNPHYHLGISAFLQGGETVLETLINIDSVNSKYYLKNFEALKIDMSKLKEKVSSILSPLKDKKFMEYHKELTYFLKEFNLKSYGAIEEVPGVPPSAGRLGRVTLQAKRSDIDLVLAVNTSPKSITNKFFEMSKIPVATLPLSIVGEGGPKNYDELIVSIANKMVEKLK